MKKQFAIAAVLLAAASAAQAQNVQINIGQPGFYGRIELGDFAPPPVIYRQPVIVERPVRYVAQQPVYLRVPPGHAKNWRKHCAKYDACGQRVLFVQDRWYTNEYAPRYAQRVRHDDDGRRGGDHRDDRYDKKDKHDKHDKHDKGNGKGHGKGHGRD
ncbi:MAG TPA: hypothetical protein VIT92_10785 [Burkholderiaceae bacterium]